MGNQLIREQIIKTLESELDTAWDVNGHLSYVIYDGDIPDVALKIEPLINQEVERRIKERMPSEEEVRNELCRHLYNWLENNAFKDGCKWLRSRLTNPGEQKTDNLKENNNNGSTN